MDVDHLLSHREARGPPPPTRIVKVVAAHQWGAGDVNGKAPLVVLSAPYGPWFEFRRVREGGARAGGVSDEPDLPNPPNVLSLSGRSPGG